MRKILLSLGMIAFVGAVAAGATGAFFNDTETSTGNTFAAGAIDLTIDSVSHYNGMVCTLVEQTYRWIPEANVTLGEGNQPIVGEVMNDMGEWNIYNTDHPAQYPQAGAKCTGTWPLKDLSDNEVALSRFFDFDDIKPGDNGENTISVHIATNDAWMCASLRNVDGADLDGTKTEPEDAVDDTYGETVADSELDENLHFFAWVDNGNNVYEPGPTEPVLGDATASELVNGTWALADSGTANGPIAAGGTQYIGVAWCAGTWNLPDMTCNGSTMGNIAQTDSWSTDIEFYIEQARNNSQFLCASRDQQAITAPAAPEEE